MSSKTDQCKRALGHIGINSTLRDVDNDNTAESRACLLFYDQCVGSLLELRPWYFAERQVPLVLSDQAPPEEWAFLYAFPENCARANSIVDPLTQQGHCGTGAISRAAKPVPFRVISLDDGSGRGILCNQEDAILWANLRIEEPEMFPFIFSTALELMIATFVATPLRADAAISAAAERRLAVWLPESVTQTQNAQQDGPMPDGEAVTGRG